MQRIMSRIILTLIIVAALSSCDKAPRHVIGEHDMVGLLVDIHEAESLIDMYPQTYGSDSMRKVLKQSVFMKHGVTAEKFDTSLVWYSRNMAVYAEVYEKVVNNLEQKRNDLEVKSGNVVASRERRGGVKYKDFGDTADIWKAKRELVLTSSMGKAMLPFVYLANSESAKGDKYTLRFKTVNNKAGLKAFVGIEYGDGAMTFIERPATSTGWNEVSVQSDSLKKIKNVFGYIKFNLRSKQTICYVDSVMLLRTHLDRNTYGLINMQKTLDRNKQVEADKNDKTATVELVPDVRTAPIETPEAGFDNRRMGVKPRSKGLIREQAIVVEPAEEATERKLSPPKSKKR